MVNIIDLQINDPRWRRIPKLRARLEEVAIVTLASLPKSLSFPVTATLLLTNDKTVRKLNRDFRGLDKATNVLSFPQFEPSQLTKKGKAKAPIELGDIVIAYQYVAAESKNKHKILINHTIHLFIHGLLHLFGYDHLSDKDADRMERLEKQIMAKLHLPDPYEYAEQSKGSRYPNKAKTVTRKRAK